jgi:L-threonylcarbamoyladenylate synthase
MTKVISVDPETPFEKLRDELKPVAQAILEGALVAFPTETVYGLGCNPFDKGAVERLYEIKGRPKGRPLPLLVNSQRQVEVLAVEISDTARALMERFFPGPLTLILKRSEVVPDEVCAYTEKVGVRCPKHNIPLALIDACGVPLATPSANLSGHISPTDAGEVLRQLGGRIDFVIDGGRTSIGIESTVIDMTVEPPKIIRLGSITPEEIEAVIGKAVEVDEGAMGARYRPLHARMVLVDIEEEEGRIRALIESAKKHLSEGARVCLLATDETVALLRRVGVPSGVALISIGSRHDLDEVALHIYERISASDREGFDTLIVEGLPRERIGLAIMQRLSSAAHEIIR